MQPLQYDLRDPVAKDNSITNAATARSNLDAAIYSEGTILQLQITMEFHLQLLHSTTYNPIYSEGTILELQITMEFHQQLIHQHHLQPNLKCGNDPTVANQNRILSTTHARKTVETPFTMRNRSDHDPNISENDPTTHETVSHPSHRRGRSSTFGDGLCMEKHRLSCICSLSQKRILFETSFKTPSATHPPAPLATPFAMRERSYSCKSQWNSVDHTCTKNN